MNALAEQLTGWTQADAVGRAVVEVFPIVAAKTREPVPNPALEALAKGVSVALAQSTLLITKAGTECPIDDSAAPIRDVNGKVAGAVMVFRDITERRRLEEHLRQAQKLEAIGRLAAGIAHDFNNILTVITGYSALLLDTPQPAEVQQEFVRRINLAGHRAATLTQQILAFSRKQRLLPSVLSLNNIVWDMSGMVQRLIGEDIEFVIDTAPDLGSVKADPTQLGQVLLNLALNARDAMPYGGKLTVSTANTERNEPSAGSDPDVKPGKYAVLSVTDTGSGMSEDVLAHVFEPFFTTKEVGKGTGLGLASAHGIVKQSGGHIEVSSQVGVGTMFRVYLPLVEEPKAEAPRIDPRQKLKGHETILLVEDEEPVRRMTKLVLQQCGYQVLEAMNGQDAVTLSDGYDGVIHLLITDLVMPQLSGRIVAERLALTRPTMRVLFMSGYTEDLIVTQGVESATADLLHKPFSLDALSKKVREILDRR
jgi:PAS domain S-box-containing protein